MREMREMRKAWFDVPAGRVVEFPAFKFAASVRCGCAANAPSVVSAPRSAAQPSSEEVTAGPL